MKQKSKKLILLFIISLVMILGFATIVNAADDEFKLTVTTADIVLNGSKYLTYTNAGSDTVTWSSSNDNVATVDSKGNVTAKAIGTATITATAGTKTATCTINVVYGSYVKASCDDVVLVIGEYENKTITITAVDYHFKEINNPEAQWKSNDESIAKVDSNGKINAVKAGTTKVIATIAGATKEINVSITNLPTFTDYSKAEYELTTNLNMVNLNIKNVKINESMTYYYCITSTNEKPKVELEENGHIDLEKNKNWKLFDGLNASIEEYVQLNQDMYLWICERASLEKSYKDDNNTSVEYVNKYVVTGQKLTRPKSPVYAELFRSTFMTYDTDQIVFNIPYATDTERKFTMKIGKITDKNILNGIKNNNGEAWNSLLDYAKKSNAVFNDKLTTNVKYSAEYSGSERLGNVIKINGLEDKEYYFMYVVFDDENGKYYPQSGLTIAKADVFTEGDIKGHWYLFFLGDDKFKWDDFGTIQTGTATVDGNHVGTTKAEPTTLPYTGITAVGLAIVAMVGTAVFFKVKNNKYKGI